MDLLVLCPFWDITISLRRPLWDKPCLPRVYFETCPLSYDNHYETRPFWDMSFFLHQPLWDMTILRHDIFPTLPIMRHDHFETWHFSYFNHYETWPFWDMKFFPHKPLWEKTILRHVFLQLHNLINKHFFFPLLVRPTISTKTITSWTCFLNNKCKLNKVWEKLLHLSQLLFQWEYKLHLYYYRNT